jgi:2-hydroxychromene-2-carboxylate isomerase
MGDVIRLADRRAARRTRNTHAHAPSRVEFLFDLCSPFSYLAAERVERAFDDVVWTPACTASLTCGSETDPDTLEQQRRYAEQRAAELRLPLVWPERHPGPVPAAMRAAAYAAEQGRGAAFVLAAGRLAFCGGFDLDDPEILAEASAAAGIGMEGCLQAVGDVTRDGAIEDAGRRLLAAGAEQLPALRVGRALFWGENRVADAAAVARMQAAAAARA